MTVDSNEVTATAVIGRRRAARARLQLNVEVETTTGVNPAVLRNLSCTGAMLEGEKLPPLDRTTVIKRDGITAMGVVVWNQENRCGVEFFDPLELEDVISASRLPPEALPYKEPYYWRLDRDNVSAEDWRKNQELVRRKSGRLRSFS